MRIIRPVQLTRSTSVFAAFNRARHLASMLRVAAMGRMYGGTATVAVPLLLTAQQRDVHALSQLLPDSLIAEVGSRATGFRPER
jgi:hypothetical protein